MEIQTLRMEVSSLSITTRRRYEINERRNQKASCTTSNAPNPVFKSSIHAIDFIPRFMIRASWKAS